MLTPRRHIGRHIVQISAQFEAVDRSAGRAAGHTDRECVHRIAVGPVEKALFLALRKLFDMPQDVGSDRYAANLETLYQPWQIERRH
jgi:hypothetical protein